MPREFVVERAAPASISLLGQVHAGAMTCDVTPALGAPLSGYGSIRSEAATRMCGRLFATALVIDDGQGERVALVALDLHAGTRYLAELAAARLAASCGIGIDRLFLAGTHTHSGPGHVYGNTLYDGMTARERGLDRRGAAEIAEGIALAVEGAALAMRPARLGCGTALCWGYSMNRSLEAFSYDGASPKAFARRFGSLPAKKLTEENMAVDPRVSILWAEGVDGNPIGAFGTFGAHATAIPARHATLSADVFGRAVRFAQDRMVRAGVSNAHVPIAFAAGAVGDVDLDMQGIGAHKMVERQGIEIAGRIGEVYGTAIDEACRSARLALTTDVRLRPLFAEPEPRGAWLADGRRLADEAAYGVPALAGSELGRNFMLDPTKLSTALSLEGQRGAYEADDPHAPKLMAMRGLVARITGTAAPVLPLRLVEIGLGARRVSIVGIPGEPTTRFASAVEHVLRDRGAEHVIVSGVTGDYAGYFTAEKEYEKQHYEGACTIWGRATLGFVCETLRALHDRGSPTISKIARFAEDASFPPPSDADSERRDPWPAAPALEASGPNLYGRWTALAAEVPRFAPEPWIVLEEEHEGAFRRVRWNGADVTDQTRDFLVERTARGSHASWTFRWQLPLELRQGTLRFVLLPNAFGGPLASNTIVVNESSARSASREHGDLPPVDWSDDFQHPTSEEEIVALVRLAGRRRCPLRVRGSGHSIAQAIYTDARLDGRAGAIDVMLDRYTRIEIDDQRRRVTVQAGCHLGLDPRDPTGTSTWENSLLAALDARGWALPDLGGVTHQTVSGFLMTGSSGGTVMHSIEDAVVAIRFIDGRGEIHDVERDKSPGKSPNKDELFDAVLCSMGLLGVVSTLTFQCIPRFDIVGREDITTEKSASYGLFDGGSRGLGAFLRKTEYARLMWWPQRGVERVVTWQARRMTDADYTPETGKRGALRPKAYQALGDDMPQGRLARPTSMAVQWAGGKFYDAMDSASYARRTLEQKLPLIAPVGKVASSLFEKKLLPAVLGQFVPLDAKGPQRFWDTWHDGLPMDNQMSEQSLPTTFTEIFVPLDETARAMKLLRDHFRAGGLDATGSFIFEIYAARATKAWLHPAYHRDSLRIDVFWFERNREEPTRFFEQFWDLFAPLGYRLHWGKHLPRDPSRGARYLRRQYPRWDDFMRVRAELDPFDLFVNDHFRAALELSDGPSSIHAEDGETTNGERRSATASANGEGRSESSVSSSSKEKNAIIDRFRAFYEDLATGRESVLGQLGDLFTADIAFRDPFRHTHGLAELRVLFDRMFEQYTKVGFSDFKFIGNDEGFSATYEMHLRMPIGPDFVTRMCSVCTTRDGKISELHDYYDFASSLVSPVDLASRGYRWVTNKLFL